MSGERMHPQPRARLEGAHEHSHHRFKPYHRHSLRNGFNGFLRALPGVHDFLVTVACRSPRVGPVRADIANEQTWHQPRGARTTRLRRPRSRRPSGRAAASTAFRPNVRDGRETPLIRDLNRTRTYLEVGPSSTHRSVPVHASSPSARVALRRRSWLSQNVMPRPISNVAPSK